MYIILISVYGERILQLWMGDLVEFNDELMFLLLLRMFFIVTGYSIQNYETAKGTPTRALTMELFIVIFSLSGFLISYFVGADVYGVYDIFPDSLWYLLYTCRNDKIIVSSTPALHATPCCWFLLYTVFDQECTSSFDEG